MPTIKVKQNGVWKVISTAGNNSNAKDYSTVVITYDSSTMLASLNSLDIFNLVLEGRNVVLNSDEIIYPLIEATEDLISFSVTSIGDDISGTVYITIDNNKQVTKIINKGITIPVPTKNDTNKILSVGTNNNAQWINIPSGSGSSSVYLQDEEPENANVGSLWLDTDEENDANCNVSSNEISTAISEHNISTTAHEDIRKTITQADYSEDDSSSMSYIKNRPFYEGKTFAAINTILNNEIVHFLPESGTYMAEIEIADEFLISSQIKPNTKYKVIFDGMEFIEESTVYDLSEMGFFYGAFIGENPMLALMAMELAIDNYIPEKPFVISSFNGSLILISFIPGETHTITLQELQPCETGIIFEEQATISAADLALSNRMPATIIKNVGVNLLPGNEYKIIINNYEHNGFYIVEGNIPGIMIGNELGAILQAANDYIFMPLSPSLTVSKKHIIIKKSNNTIIYDNELNIAIITVTSRDDKTLFVSTAVDDSLENPESLDFSGQTFTEGEKIILSVDGKTYDLTLTSLSDILIGQYETEEGKLIGLGIVGSTGSLSFAEETITINVKLEGPSMQRKTLNSKFIDILPALTPWSDDGLVLGAENGLWKPIEAQASSSPLPGVSTADNDKVLMVVNGVWQPASITSGDEVAY